MSEQSNPEEYLREIAILQLWNACELIDDACACRKIMEVIVMVAEGRASIRLRAPKTNIVQSVRRRAAKRSPKRTSQRREQ